MGWVRGGGVPAKTHTWLTTDYPPEFSLLCLEGELEKLAHEALYVGRQLGCLLSFEDHILYELGGLGPPTPDPACPGALYGKLDISQ